MALKCFLPCVFQSVSPSDNHNYVLHCVVSHTQGSYLQTQQVADCFPLFFECVFRGRLSVRGVFKTSASASPPQKPSDFCLLMALAL